MHSNMVSHAESSALSQGLEPSSRSSTLISNAAIITGMLGLIALAPGSVRAQDGYIDPIQYTERHRDNGVQVLLNFSMGPQGDWEWSGSVQDLDTGEDHDWFAMCALRASSGEMFQFSAQGSVSAYGGSAQFPLPGRPLYAGRNPELAAAWPSISEGYTASCSFAAQEKDSGGNTFDDLFAGLQKIIGAANGLVTLAKAIL